MAEAMGAGVTKRRSAKFSKVYKPQGWQSIMEMSSNPLALRLFSFLCLHADHLNAVAASADLLASELGVHIRSIRRATKWLEDNNHVVTVRLANCNCFIINPDEVFANLDKYRGYVAFSSRALARKDATLKKRLNLLIGKQPDLFPEEEEKKEDDTNA